MSSFDEVLRDAIRIWLESDAPVPGAAREVPDVVDRLKGTFKSFDFRPLMRTGDQYLSRLCQVRTPTADGTGFLVAPDIVLTNYHVIEGVLDNDQAARQARFIFDFAASYDASQADTTAYALHRTDWRIAESRPSEDERRDVFDDDRPASPDRLDFAAVRLAGTPGKDQVSLAGITQERGWFDLAKVSDELPRPGALVFVFHHPLGGSAKFSFNAFLKTNTNGTRVRYQAFTAPGSSGGLVVNDNLDIIGLHHAGRMTGQSDHDFSEGIPLSLIRNLIIDGGGQIKRKRPARRCVVVIPSPEDGDMVRHVERRRDAAIVPAIKSLDEDVTIEELDRTDTAALDTCFSPLRTADLTVIYLGPCADAFTVAAIGFRAALGKPSVVLAEETDSGLAPGVPTVQSLIAARFKAFSVPYDMDDKEVRRRMRSKIQDALEDGPWGPVRVHPWTLLEFSADSERYLDANDDAAAVLLGEGHTAVDLVGRNGREVVEELKARIHPDQWQEFDAEQAKLYEVILKANGRLREGDLEKLSFAGIPMIFQAERRQAVLPLLTKYAFNEAGDERRHQVEVIHVDVTPWISMAYDGHWQVRPSCGPDGLQRLERAEQVKSFLPIGILRIGRDGDVLEISRGAELLLGWAKGSVVNRPIGAVTVNLDFATALDKPGPAWYAWDAVPEPQLPPLGIHSFARAGQAMRGCYLGLRDPVSNEADGCVWFFAPAEAREHAAFVDRLKGDGEREWLWQCYAGSYDRVLTKCEYYKTVRDIHVNAMLRSLKDDPESTLLDVGAGTGNVCLAVLRQHTASKVIAVDSSRAMMQVLSRKLREPERARCTLLEMAAEEMTQGVPGVDAVSVMMALFDMENYELALDNIHLVLRPGGTIVITEPKLNLQVEEVIRGAKAQLLHEGIFAYVQKDWNIVIASGRKLAKQMKENQRWRGVEGILRWLTDHGYNCETPIECYFGQCQTLTARKP